MKIQLPVRRAGGLTLIEFIVVIAALALLVLSLIPAFAGNRAAALRIQCMHQLKENGLAFHQWAADQQGLFPMQLAETNGGTSVWRDSDEPWSRFQMLSNEFKTPKNLWCPADRKRKPAINFGLGFTNSNISYFLSVDLSPAAPRMFLMGDRNLTNSSRLRSGLLILTTNEPVGWNSELHARVGNVVLADGSVQLYSSRTLKIGLCNSGVATNHLALP